MRISFVGKGGTGKTTLSALLINYLIENNQVPILAVDADPNFNLNELLGIEIETTLSEIRESLLRHQAPEFMSGYDYVELKINEILVEDKYFDLLVMGYPEKSGCYCPIHSFLSTALEKLMKGYSYIVIDNEAGMEHLSRLNLIEMEHLIIVSDESLRGISTAGRIADLVKALNIKAEKIWLVVNNLTSFEPPKELKEYTEKIANSYQIEILGFLPKDQTLVKYELNHIPVFEWKNILKEKAFSLFTKLFN